MLNHQRVMAQRHETWPFFEALRTHPAPPALSLGDLAAGRVFQLIPGDGSTLITTKIPLFPTKKIRKWQPCQTHPIFLIWGSFSTEGITIVKREIKIINKHPFTSDFRVGLPIPPSPIPRFATTSRPRRPRCIDQPMSTYYMFQYQKLHIFCWEKECSWWLVNLIIHICLMVK